jgi:hypothetical protein
VTRLRFLELAALLVVLGAAAYEAAVALKWIPVGPEPGDSARFEGLVMILAALALLAAALISLVRAAQDRRSLPAALFPIAAAALMVARYYTFDTYYLPTLTRYSSGEISSTWIYGLAVAGLAASILSQLRARVGFLVAPVVILLCLITASAVGIGK